MKGLFTTAVITFTAFATLGQTIIKTQEMLKEYWHYPSWDYGSLQTAEYDTAGNVLSSLYQNYISNIWENWISSENIYDSTGRAIQSTNLTWDDFGGAWYISNLRDYSYNGLTTTILQKSRNNPNDALLPSYYHTIVNNNNGDIVTNTRQKPDSLGNWVNDIRSSYTYTVQGYTATKLSEKWDNSSQTWYTDKKTEYTYDVNGNITVRNIYLLSSTTNTLVNGQRNTFTYNSDDLLLVDITELWTNNAWENNHRIEYSYNSDGLPDTVSSGNWNGSNFNSGKSRSFFEYNQYNLLYRRISQTFNIGYQDYSRETYLYTYYSVDTVPEDTTGIIGDFDPSDPDQAFVQVYPNPATTNIRVLNLGTSALQLSLYDLNGHLVLTEETTRKQHTINVSDLPPGLYLLLVESNEQRMVKTISIE